MSEVTSLKCWPSCVSSIHWSEDGIIALASDDMVELLFPNIQAQESDGDVPHWQHFPLQAPWFTKEELPPKESAPFEIYSVGEEISSSYPIALGWSPPGLAKHRRCALGVLTANLTLSIWDSDGKPQDASSWNRKLIVNDALETFFSNESVALPSRITSGPEDAWRLRRRVRAFAWAPALPTTDSCGIVGTSPSWLRQLVAVANDDNHIVFLVVNSPTSKLGTDDSWSSEVIGYFSFVEDQKEAEDEPYTFDQVMNQQRHAMHLSWSPWIKKGDGLQSILAYATNEDIRLRIITYSGGNIQFGAETVCPEFELRFAGPMTWSPVVDDEKLTLAFFTTEEAVFLTISANDASILDGKAHHVDGRWDDISGFAWDTHDSKRTRLHFTSLTSTTRNPTCVLELSPDSVSSVSTTGWPYWREQILGSQGHFSADNELKGHANARVWGLSASPLGEYIASVHTCHPTDMVEYGVAADRRATLSITNMWGGGTDLEFPAKMVHAESIFFTARKWIEKNVESAEDLPPVKEDILKKLMRAYLPSTDPALREHRPYDVTNIDALLVALKHNAFLDPNTLKDRYEILISQICDQNESTELPRLLIAFRLAKEIQKLPSTLVQNHGYSSRVIRSHHLLLRLVEDIMSSAPDEESDADANGELHPEAAEAPAPMAPPPPPPPRPNLLMSDELCIFCDAPIPFEDPAKAICTNGHEFNRCGLSFLAIQSPGITKYCGLCNTAFLSEQAVLNDELQAGDEMNVDHEDTELPDAPTLTEGGKAEHSHAPTGAAEASGMQPIVSPQKTRQTRRGQSETPVPTSTSDSAQQDRPSNRAAIQLAKRRGEKKQDMNVPLTLARVLFFACDACIYCGGKFVG